MSQNYRNDLCTNSLDLPIDPSGCHLVRVLLSSSSDFTSPSSAMLNLIFSQIYPGTSKIISTAFNQMLPKLYAISMMWTLNARRSIRAGYTSSGGPASTGNADFNFSTRRSRYPKASEARDSVYAFLKLTDLCTARQSGIGYLWCTYRHGNCSTHRCSYIPLHDLFQTNVRADVQTSQVKIG